MSGLEHRIRSLFRTANRREQGNVMFMALIVLAVGALLVPPTLSLVTTGVKAEATQQRLTDEIYAAEAGVEYSMWRLTQGLSVSEPIALNIGGRSVNVNVSPLVEMPYGPVVVTGGGTQSWRLEVSSEVVELGNGNYRYTVHIRNTGTSTLFLDYIAAGLPPGFTYVNGSSYEATTENPSEHDNNRLKWEFEGPGRPSLNGQGAEAKESFRIQGPSFPQGYYSWVQATNDSVGVVSSCFGYTITSQVGNTTVTANVVRNGGWVFPVSWEIN